MHDENFRKRTISNSVRSKFYTFSPVRSEKYTQPIATHMFTSAAFRPARVHCQPSQLPLDMFYYYVQYINLS